MDRLRVGIVGSGKRSDYLYCPLVQTLRDDLELVGVYGRRLEAASVLGDKHHVPAFDDLARMVEQARPDILIVAVRGAGNGLVGREAARFGLPLLLETPIASELADADAIIAESEARGFPVEVAEQYYRRPMERIKVALIRSGLLGEVHTAYNDFMGHGYHGISLVRSYVGFDVPIGRVSMVRREYPVTSHFNWTGGRAYEREGWEHGVIQFANGAVGVFDWTSIGYGSALRWQRSTRFLATGGTAVGDEVTIVSPDGKHRVAVPLERRIRNVGGMEALAEVVAHADPPVVWRNPLSRYYLEDEMIAVGDCLWSLVEAVREGKPVEYGARQGRLDQEIYLAMRRSAEHDGAPVELPLSPT
jgi:predicted dehydrogenase